MKYSTLCIVKELLELQEFQDLGIRNAEILENNFYTLRCSIDDEEKFDDFCSTFVAKLEVLQLLTPQPKQILQEASIYTCECCDILYVFIKFHMHQHHKPRRSASQTQRTKHASRSGA